MARSRNGEAVPAELRSEEAVRALVAFQQTARGESDLDCWFRATAVLKYIEGNAVVLIAAALDVGESSVYDGIGWYRREGLQGLASARRGRSEPRLSASQREALGALLDAGPLSAGFTTGLWTGKRVAALILEKFGVAYHPQSVPRLLHQMKFSVQRPRKRLARADAEAQAAWRRERLPAIKKKPRTAAG